MDQELVEYLDRRFEETTRQIESNRREMAAHRKETVEGFERVEGEIRRTRVLIEDVRHDVQTVAEGFEVVEQRRQQLRETVATERRDDRAISQGLYLSLTDRVDDLEHRVKGLETAD